MKNTINHCISKYYNIFFCLIIGFLFFLNIGYGAAQTTQADSLQLLAQNEPNDSLRVRKFIDLARAVEEENPQKALEALEEALAIATKSKNAANEAAALHAIGTVHYKHDNYSQAIDYLLKSLKINEKIGNELGIGHNYLVIGNTYYNLEQYNEAEKYNTKALAIYKKLGKKLFVSMAINNLANVAYLQRNYTKAIEGYKESLNMNTQMHDEHAALLCLNNISLTYLAAKDYTNSADYGMQALQIAQELESYFNVSMAAKNLAEVHLFLKDSKKAEKYANIALDAANKVNSKLRAKEALLTLVSVYKSQKNTTKALDFLEKARAIDDSIYNENVTQQIQALTNQYELEKKQTQIKLLEKDRKIQEESIANERLHKYLLIACLAAVLIILVLSIISLRNIRRYSRFQQEEKNKAKHRNIELAQQKEAIAVQAQHLSQLNEELKTLLDDVAEKNQMLEHLNANLDEIVQMRTGEVQEKNKKILKLAFTCAHRLRGPLARILGLVKLLEMANLPDAQKELLKHINTSAENLDGVIHEMQATLNESAPAEEETKNK